MTDGERDELFEALKAFCRECSIATLKRMAALPSPEPPPLSEVADLANAVFIDGTGKTRSYCIPDLRAEYLIPIPQRFPVWVSAAEPLPMPRNPIARFRLSSVQNGVGIYRLHSLDGV